MADSIQIARRGNFWARLKTAGELLGLIRNNGSGFIGYAKMTYDFTVDGGAIGTITPRNAPTLPAGAIILGGVIDITTALTSGGSATISLGFGSGGEKAVLKALTAVASWVTGVSLVIVPIFTGATIYKVLADGQLTLTVAVATLIGGKMDVNLVYVQGNV